MSGGGGGSKDTKPKTDTTTATPMQTVQPGMPGQISSLADQLAAGFGQQPNDVMTQLMQYYQPMSLPNYAPVPTPATPTPVTPVVTPPVVKPPKTGIIGKGSYVERSGGANR
jgi:hypothetical protein